MRNRNASGWQSSASAPGAGLLEELYESALPTVFGFCRSRLTVHDAEDVTAEVFRVAAERLVAEPEADISVAWLITVARNRIIDRWRRHGRWESRLADVGAPDAVDVSNRVEDDQILEALDRMPASQRAALVLHYVDGWSAREIGEILGRRPSAVDSLLARARRSLSAALEEVVP